MDSVLVKKRIYNKVFAEQGKNEVILWEVQNIYNNQLIKVTFLSKNSLYKQGIWLSTDKGIEVVELGSDILSSITLWEDTAPKEVVCKCHTDNGSLSFYNVWDKGKGRQSQSHTSGMLLSHEGNQFIYHCNDIGFETNFDKLIIAIELL